MSDKILQAMINAERINDSFNSLLMYVGAYDSSYRQMVKGRLFLHHFYGDELAYWRVY